MAAFVHIGTTAITGTARVTSFILKLTAGAQVGMIARQGLVNIAHIFSAWGPITGILGKVDRLIQKNSTTRQMVDSDLFKLFKSTLIPEHYPGTRNLLKAAVVGLVVAECLGAFANWMNPDRDTKVASYSICGAIIGINMTESKFGIPDRINAIFSSSCILLKAFVPLSFRSS